ncbi:MAG: polyprenyl synthetase family protein [SAR202 cluster bacterium]|nr:polyprenyl synthetase family protein [SAR202 cluster bacterium]
MTFSIADLSHRVDAELRDVFQSRDMPLYRMLSYHLAWEDRNGEPELRAGRDRVYGSACLAACAAAGGDIESALPAAAAVEMVNAFAQIHDDVEGGNQHRANRDAVWAVWGPAQAINAGDGMHALARLALLRLMKRGVSPEKTFRATQLMDRASLALCEGRYDDLEAQERINLSVKAYLKMAEAKSGALLGCAMRLGALVAQDDEQAGKAMGECGTKAGLALQVQADADALWSPGGNTVEAAIEVLNKKKLLPVVYAIEKADVRDKRRLGDIYFKRVLGREDIDAIRTLAEGLGAREFCNETVSRLRGEAAAAVDGAGLKADATRSMKKFVDFLFEGR